MIGAGNVATHLAKALAGAGKRIEYVYSRSERSAAALANRVMAKIAVQPEDLPANSDLYIVALPDAAIADVVGRLQLDNNLIVHTSGTLPAGILAEASSNFGVFYPYQTFSMARALDFRHVPLCIEAGSNDNETRLCSLAADISSSVHLIDAEKRAVLHIAGVFACNFTNMNYVIAEEMLRENGIPFDIIKPLIRETASKVMGFSPSAVQTGPAVREDLNVMKRHLELLNSKPEYAELYEMFSNLIISEKKKNG